MWDIKVQLNICAMNQLLYRSIEKHLPVVLTTVLARQ